MGRPVAVCSIVPPHILRRIAEHGDGPDRDAAWAALEASASTRGERSAYSLASLLPVKAAKKRRSVFDAENRRELPGRIAREEGARATGDVAVDEAYDGAGRTYDFYRKVFGRSSIDDDGMPLDATVHYGTRFDNAQWNGRRMIYGDGDGKYFRRFTASLEVIAHELTHGVIQHTAGLGFDHQSGALNEHFADVFGVLVKQHALKQTAARASWLIGQELLTEQVHGVAVRSMKAPGTAYDDPILGTDPQPAHMRDYRRMQFDSGGVHVNSGIPNHAFYRLAMALGGRAWEVAGRIWYLALTRKLRPTSRFRQCAEATFEAAGELFGARSEPQDAVRAAWNAVGIEVALEPKPPRRARPAIPATYDVPDGAAEVPLFPVA